MNLSVWMDSYIRHAFGVRVYEDILRGLLEEARYKPHTVHNLASLLQSLKRLRERALHVVARVRPNTPFFIRLNFEPANILIAKYKFTIRSKSDASHQCSPAWISEPMQSLLGCLGRGYRSRSYNCFDIILLSHRVHNNVPTY